MVDISKKESVYREATAIGFIKLRPETLKRIKEGTVEKGDPILIGKLAGISAAKQTHVLIPLTHPIPLSGVDIDMEILEDGIQAKATVKTTYKTGCEIDALVAVATALISVFDVVKQYEKDEEGQYPYMMIDSIKVLSKHKFG